MMEQKEKDLNRYQKTLVEITKTTSCSEARQLARVALLTPEIVESRRRGLADLKEKIQERINGATKALDYIEDLEATITSLEYDLDMDNTFSLLHYWAEVTSSPHDHLRASVEEVNEYWPEDPEPSGLVNFPD